MRNPIPDEFCTGWTAMYDAWEVRRKVRVLSVAAQLPPEDLQTAIGNNLLYGPVGGLSLLMISIPLALCPAKPVFAVGSTIFSVGSPGDILRPRLRSVRLPPDSMDEDNIGQPPPKQTHDTPSRPVKTQISPTGRHLVVSNHLFTCSPAMLRLRLFAIRTSPEVTTKCIANAEFQCLDGSELDLGCADFLRHSFQFHATLSLVIVALEHLIYVWDYARGKQLSSYIVTRFHPSMLTHATNT